jgi:S-adenosylmethionine uptake transporter
VKPPYSPSAFGVAVLGIASFSAMDAVMKGLSIAIGAYDALLWRTLAGVLIGGTVFFCRRRAWPSPAALKLHLVRGICSAGMAILFFWGLARVPMAQAVALSFVAPLIALFLAAWLLHERIGRRAILASLFGFAGVLVILSGQTRAGLGPEAFRGAVAILASAGLYAYNIVLMRQQALVADPVEVAFFMSLIMAGCFLLPAPFIGSMPPAHLLVPIVGAALLAVMSLLLLSWAYARAEAQHLVPVEYTGFVWAASFGWLLFGEPVRALTFIGAAMIVAACLAAGRRRTRGLPEVEAMI